MDTTAIILAAGENVRLQAAGLAPGRKPLLMHQGEVLIRRLCRQVRTQVSDTIIVCAPNNVEDIVFATKEYEPYYVVQPAARGPQEAVSLALRSALTHDNVLLMGDNFYEEFPLLERDTIYVTADSTDPALHPVGHGVFSDPKYTPPDWPVRWLGPVVFRRPAWIPLQDTWEASFRDVFHMKEIKGVSDMGVIR